MADLLWMASRKEEDFFISACEVIRDYSQITHVDRRHTGEDLEKIEYKTRELLEKGIEFLECSRMLALDGRLRALAILVSLIHERYLGEKRGYLRRIEKAGGRV